MFLDDFMISVKIEYQTRVHYTILVALGFPVKFRALPAADRTPWHKYVPPIACDKNTSIWWPLRSMFDYLVGVYLGQQL